MAYMLWYRFSMKLGVRRKFFPVGESVVGPFFKTCKPIANYPEEWKQKLHERAEKIVSGKLTWFHHHEFEVGNPANWFLSPFNNEVLYNPQKHWTTISDFDLNTGDIKIIWEPSRFDWLTDLARAYRVFGDPIYLETLNNWIEDWSKHNPMNQGPNWKCGQETSIRVMKIFTAAAILEQLKEVNLNLRILLWQHLQRIKKNIRYAIAQDNNHGTSEAAGVYIASIWLLSLSGLEPKQKKVLKKWKEEGKRRLEERLLYLIASEGTFAQKSITYHRVVVDTLSCVLHAIREFNEPMLSAKVLERIERLGEWQVKMTLPEHGYAPNIGSNDGAMLENLHECGYRDFRPSSQQLFGLLNNKKVYPDGGWNEPLFWRSNQSVDQVKFQPTEYPESQVLDGQFLIIKKSDLVCYLCIPNAKFRPGFDVFHLDIWYEGKNIFIDSGSYSYNAGDLTNNFKSVKAHNSVQFGTHEPMPKISRFLNAEWIMPDIVSKPYEDDGFTKCTCSYTDYMGNNHKRSIQISELLVKIIDEVDTKEKAVLRFHIQNGVQKIENNSFSFSNGTIVFDGVQEVKISFAEHSHFYLHKEVHEVLESTFAGNKIVTEIRLDKN